MNRRGAAIVLATLVAGCAASSPGPAALLLARADEQVGAEKYEGALDLYNEFLRTHAGDPAEPRVRTARVLLTGMLASQAAVEQLKAAVEQLKAEVEQLKAERERLRADLERLRSIDLRPGPRR